MDGPRGQGIATVREEGGGEGTEERRWGLGAGRAGRQDWREHGPGGAPLNGGGTSEQEEHVGQGAP